MSIPKNQATLYHTGTPQVNHRAAYVRLDGLDEKGYPNLRVNGGLNGRVVLDDIEQEGVVETNKARLGREDIVSLPTEEKQIIKQAVAILERELGKKIASLKDEPHDDSDVMT
jgi:hypothetical protein